MLLIFAIPAGLTYTFGRMAKSQRQGWAIFGAMAVLFLVGVTVAYAAESGPNAALAGLGVDQSAGNMEGKEVRFGVANSALFATVTTDASCGAVNSMHDSFTPLGGLVPLTNIMLGEVIFGGVGAGLYGVLVMVLLSVFIAGLMVGRTPEYLGKKIEAREMKAAMLYVLVFPAAHPRIRRVGGGVGLRAELAQQRRTTRPERDPLRVHQRHRQQRLGVRRPEREHALLQHDAGARDAGRPLPDDRSRHGDRRLDAGQEDRRARTGHVPHQRCAVLGAAAWR